MTHHTVANPEAGDSAAHLGHLARDVGAEHEGVVEIGCDQVAHGLHQPFIGLAAVARTRTTISPAPGSAFGAAFRRIIGYPPRQFAKGLAR